MPSALEHRVQKILAKAGILKGEIETPPLDPDALAKIVGKATQAVQRQWQFSPPLGDALRRMFEALEYVEPDYFQHLRWHTHIASRKERLENLNAQSHHTAVLPAGFVLRIVQDESQNYVGQHKIELRSYKDKGPRLIVAPYTIAQTWYEGHFTNGLYEPDEIPATIQRWFENLKNRI